MSRATVEEYEQRINSLTQKLTAAGLVAEAINYSSQLIDSLYVLHALQAGFTTALAVNREAAMTRMEKAWKDVVEEVEVALAAGEALLEPSDTLASNIPLVLSCSTMYRNLLGATMDPVLQAIAAEGDDVPVAVPVVDTPAIEGTPAVEDAPAEVTDAAVPAQPMMCTVL